MGVPRKNKRGKSDPRKTDREAGQKGEAGERSAKVRNERRTSGRTARKRNSCVGDEGLGERERKGGEKERRRSPWLDIKNVSCGNLTTDKGRQGRGAGYVARKAQEGCVEKQEWKERRIEKREKRE